MIHCKATWRQQNVTRSYDVAKFSAKNVTSYSRVDREVPLLQAHHQVPSDREVRQSPVNRDKDKGPVGALTYKNAVKVFFHTLKSQAARLSLSSKTRVDEKPSQTNTRTALALLKRKFK